MFDPTTQSWSKQSGNSNFYLNNSEEVFVIGDNAYVLVDNHVWQYNQPSNQWTQKQNFPGTSRFGGTAIAVNGKGYLGLGTSEPDFLDLKDWWQYDPGSDSWTQKHDFGGDARDDAGAFSIDGKGYVLFGFHNGTAFKTVWQYDPVTDGWTKKQNCPASAQSAPASAVIGGVDVGLMTDGNDLWEYNPATDSWSDQGAVLGGYRQWPAGFVIGDSYFLANLSVVAYNWSR